MASFGKEVTITVPGGDGAVRRALTENISESRVRLELTGGGTFNLNYWRARRLGGESIPLQAGLLTNGGKVQSAVTVMVADGPAAQWASEVFQLRTRFPGWLSYGLALGEVMKESLTESPRLTAYFPDPNFFRRTDRQARLNSKIARAEIGPNAPSVFWGQLAIFVACFLAGLPLDKTPAKITTATKFSMNGGGLQVDGDYLEATGNMEISLLKSPQVLVALRR